MQNNTDCDRVRLQLMAVLDGEQAAVADADRHHVSTCDSCRQWLQTMESVALRLRTLQYPDAQKDLWSVVGQRIEDNGRRSVMLHVWPIAALVLAWRALLLLVDVPMPALHPLVPLAAAVTLAWRIGRDLLAIEVMAPELRK